MSAPLSGKVALVTGGSGGLGAVICQQLAAAGASLIVGYNRSRESAQAVVNDLPTEAGQQHCALAAPVTDSATIEQLAQQVAADYGRCDILVNCAGATRFVAHDDLSGLDDELIDQILATNVRGPFVMVRAFRSLLEKHDNGLVVNISSIAADTAMGSNVMYCASKAAVNNMTKSLARALAPKVRVVSVSPGLVDTEFVKQMDVTWRDQQAEKTPLRRLAAPEEIAAAVQVVATHLTFSTGCVIGVDGGRPLS
jgi:3-oxoacyl-[acyl-carrier protein] reductase